MSTYFRGVNANLITLYDSPPGSPAVGTYGLYNPGSGNAGVMLFANGASVLRIIDSDGLIIQDNAAYNLSKTGTTEFKITSGGALGQYVPTGSTVDTTVNATKVMSVGASGIDLTAAGSNITKSGAGNLSVESQGGDVVLDAAASQAVNLRVGSASIARVTETGITIQDDSAYNLSKAGATEFKITSGAGVSVTAASGSTVKTIVDTTTQLEVKTGELVSQADTVTLAGSGATTTISKSNGTTLELSAPTEIKTTAATTNLGGFASVTSDGLNLTAAGSNITKTASGSTLELDATSADIVMQRSGTTQLTVGATAVTFGAAVTRLSAAEGLTIQPALDKDLTFAASGDGSVIFDISTGVYPKLSGTFDGKGANDLATKGYVDSLAAGIQPKAGCRVATTAQLAANFTAPAPPDENKFGSITATSNGAIVIDGVTLSVADRVLVKNGCTNQTGTTSLANGIYAVTATGDGSNPYVLTRASDADGTPASDVTSGIYTYILEGTVNANIAYILTTPNPITLNTTPLTFNIFSNGGSGITGPGSSTNHALVRWDGTDGKIVMNSDVTLAGGTMTFDATNEAKLVIGSTTSSAFELQVGGPSVYMRADAGNKTLEFPQGALILSSATSGTNFIRFPLNQAAGFKLSTSSADYLTAVSTTGSLAVVSNQDFQLGKGQKASVTSITGSGSLTLSEDQFVVTVSGNSTVGLTLPSASDTKHSGRMYKIVNANAASGDVTISTTGGQTISGSSTPVVLTFGGSHISLISNGANWFTM